jgi:hypothetical protein
MAKLEDQIHKEEIEAVTIVAEEETLTGNKYINPLIKFKGFFLFEKKTYLKYNLI